jgi:hypothetical protein
MLIKKRRHLPSRGRKLTSIVSVQFTLSSNSIDLQQFIDSVLIPFQKTSRCRNPLLAFGGSKMRGRISITILTFNCRVELRQLWIRGALYFSCRRITSVIGTEYRKRKHLRGEKAEASIRMKRDKLWGVEWSCFLPSRFFFWVVSVWILGWAPTYFMGLPITDWRSILGSG